MNRDGVEAETSCKGGCPGCWVDINPFCPFPHPGGSFKEARRQPIIHSARSDSSLKWEKEKGKPDCESLNFLSGYRKNIVDGSFLIWQMDVADFRVLVELECRNMNEALVSLGREDLADSNGYY